MFALNGMKLVVLSLPFVSASRLLFEQIVCEFALKFQMLFEIEIRKIWSHSSGGHQLNQAFVVFGDLFCLENRCDSLISVVFRNSHNLS